ncbi:TPA: hypothetical protein ACS78C_002642 [Providencia alcalifaciens]|uniref:hypothetical protein n=1 Tax=Providencia alcalifaciens TaxID=126385 RepID=UPI0012B55754|nr:hypothetical protein [Providencia alcalifaciens]MTC39807.1 hypothetical protein [Providencia alcalifaciens]
MPISFPKIRCDTSSALKLYIQKTNQGSLSSETKISLIANQIAKIKSRHDFFNLKNHETELKDQNTTHDFIMTTMDDASWDDESFESCEKLPAWKQEIYDDFASNKFKKWDKQTKPLIHNHYDGTVFAQYFNAKEEQHEDNHSPTQAPSDTATPQISQPPAIALSRKLKTVKQEKKQINTTVKPTVFRTDGTPVSAKQQLASSDRLSKHESSNLTPINLTKNIKKEHVTRHTPKSTIKPVRNVISKTTHTRMNSASEKIRASTSFNPILEERNIPNEFSYKKPESPAIQETKSTPQTIKTKKINGNLIGLYTSGSTVKSTTDMTKNRSTENQPIKKNISSKKTFNSRLEQEKSVNRLQNHRTQQPTMPQSQDEFVMNINKEMVRNAQQIEVLKTDIAVKKQKAEIIKQRISTRK